MERSMAGWKDAIKNDTSAIRISLSDWEWYREHLVDVLTLTPQYTQEDGHIRLRTVREMEDDARAARFLTFCGIPVIADESLPDGSFICVSR